MPDLYQITDEPVKPGDLHDVVLADSDGAVTSFAGVVRDNTKGRSTRYLEYDVYAEMAEKEMRAIGEEVKSRWEVDAVGILHGRGRMEI
ncbi:MAG: hypothetical protein CL902_06755, partial [Dehalococcoidia bacterium]|nr:hypothetical protein [Dehalococcoidia bacterium]